MADKKITPVIKKQRVKTEDFEVCPHCNEEIREKSTYVDPDNFVYHRPCKDKGPIDKIEPVDFSWPVYNPTTLTAHKGITIAIPLYAGCKKKFMKQSENKIDFFPISVPIGSEDFNLFDLVLNQGIDAHLEGFIKSNFSNKLPVVKGLPGRLEMNFHISEIPILLRRLREIGTEESERWADDIEDVLKENIEEQTQKQTEEDEERLFEKTYQDLMKEIEAKSKDWLKKNASLCQDVEIVKGDMVYTIDGVEYEFDYTARIYLDPSCGRDEADVEPTGHPQDLPDGWMENNWEKLEEEAIKQAQDQIVEIKDFEAEERVRQKQQKTKAPTKEKSEEEIIEETLQSLFKETGASTVKDPNIRIALAIKKAMRKLSEDIERLISNISEYNPQQIIVAISQVLGHQVDISPEDIKSGALMTLDEGKLREILELLRHR